MTGYLSGIVSVGEEPELFRLELTELEIVQLVAKRKGFSMVDVEPDPTGVKIRASSGQSGSVTVKGQNLAEACRKMVKAIW